MVDDIPTAEGLNKVFAGQARSDKNAVREEIEKWLPDLNEGQLKEVLYKVRRMALPNVAPERYAERADKKEDAVSFVSRVYGPYLTGVFTRADLGRLDRQALASVVNWESYHKQRAPLNLPSLRETTVRDAEIITSGVDEARRHERLQRYVKRKKRYNPSP